MVGDRQGRFEQVYDAYSGLILAYAVRRTSDPADAADIVSEVFTVAWRRIEDVPAGEQTRPWLYGVARRVLSRHHRGNRRCRRRPTLAVAAGLAIVAAVLVVVTGVTPNGGSAAFAVRPLPNGLIEVDFDTDLRDGHALEAELREHGVEVDVVAVPSSPSAVGAVYGMAVPGQGEEPGLEWVETAGGGTSSFTIDPAVFRGNITLHLSVEAAEGESYTLREEVFEPGEILGGLHCALGEPVRPIDVAPYLDELGVDAIWNVAAPVEGDPSMMQEERTEQVPDGQVLWGYALDATTVEFTVKPDGVTLDGAYQPRLSDLPCTPEQASRWQ